MNAADNSSYSADTELSKVRSPEKRQVLFEVLHSEHPDHYSRLWMAGFLKSVGYTLEEICSIIDSEASWSDYDAKVTWLHVRSLWRGQKSYNDISTRVEGEFEGERSPEVPPHINQRSIQREERNRNKYHNWDDYKKHLLSSHSEEWYGEFNDNGVCCKCGLTVVDCFNLHVHHLSYSPVKTAFIHANCHNPEYHYTEKLRRYGDDVPQCTIEYVSCKDCKNKCRFLRGSK